MISVPAVEETGLVVVLPIARAQRGYSCYLYDQCSKRGGNSLVFLPFQPRT